LHPTFSNGAGTAIYCTGCNERFLQGDDDGRCPRCGAPTDEEPTDGLNETLLCRDALDMTDGFVVGTPAPDGCAGVHASRTPALDGCAGVHASRTPPPKNLDDLAGKRLHIYDCHSLLGAGGMGRVYLATNSILSRKCALKVLSPRVVAHNIDYVARFRNEGRSAASMLHPNIVTIHATGEADGRHYLEMEFISGRPLQQLINDEGRLTPVRATVLSRGIAEGLAEAHRCGVLHRDLKPDNVLLTKAGLPKLVDFGLAKQILAESDKERLVGTPNFMAPEVLLGSPATNSSDVYALGVCYFLMLTGRLPFTGGTLNDLRKSVTSDPVPNIRKLVPEINLEIAECVNLLLAKSPENRPSDGIEASQLLQAVAGQVRDLESLLLEAFQDSDGISWSRINSRYEIRVDLPEGRRQTLFLEPSEHSGAEKLLLIYSVCCPADAQYYEEALRLNSLVPHGALAIREIDGRSHFIMVETYPRATVDPEEIRRSVLEVATRADDVENRLTGADAN
jgi:serine/threonine-protein kinase